MRLISVLAISGLVGCASTPVPQHDTSACVGDGDWPFGGEVVSDFDRCFSAEWGAQGCTSGVGILPSGYDYENVLSCSFRDISRDRASGGFRVETQCIGYIGSNPPTQSSEIWTRQGDARLINGEVVDYICTETGT